MPALFTKNAALTKCSWRFVIHFFRVAAFNMLFVSSLCAQKNLDLFVQGKVIDESTGKPIGGCSVYLSNTSKGDVTNDQGAFYIKNLQAGKYELVISAIGYGTNVIGISSADYPHDLIAKLQIHETELSEVIVQPTSVNGWNRWGRIFLENFIGTTGNSDQCRIRNKDVVKFWFSEKNNKLTARADEPIILDNDALGYTLKFKLEEFTSDFDAELVFYLGYPFFQEMESDNQKTRAKWAANRKSAYNGSVLHFMRSIYRDRFKENGFRIVAFEKGLNIEKQRVKDLVRSQLLRSPQQNEHSFASDSILLLKANKEYYRRILKQPDSLSRYVSLESVDSLMIDNEDNSKSLYFESKLEVIYNDRSPRFKQQQSEIYLMTPEPIQIQENGSYFSPREMIVSDHWAVYEKVANLLPFDYIP
ncbi:MAG TPA: carboxypeptidase-like regulatory domain-containing protein [Chryseolinea sp.]|nr:carboxypeptidase-like regulatory domain-containing protein [Chryseolinea sp.]